MPTVVKYEYTCDCCGKTYATYTKQSDYLKRILVPIKCERDESYYPFNYADKEEYIDVCPTCLEEMRTSFCNNFKFKKDLENHITREI